MEEKINEKLVKKFGKLRKNGVETWEGADIVSKLDEKEPEFEAKSSCTQTHMLDHLTPTPLILTHTWTKVISPAS